MLPVIALVGRPNVGKSTLFNRLTRSRDALVADQPGLTRDRQYGTGKLGNSPYLVVDTGGISGDLDGVDQLMVQQVEAAIEESDHIFFMVDAKEGCAGSDFSIADVLRRTGKPVTIVANKSESLDGEMAKADFYGLGLGDPVVIAAAHGRGVKQLVNETLETLPEASKDDLEEDKGTQIAVVGRPNVGKSTLVNRLLGEERVVAFDEPGTTRDSVFITYEHDDKPYTIIDTAGVRRRSRVNDMVEKFSVLKTLQAIQQANVIMLVLDARQEVSEQDAHLAGHILDSGRALVVVVNKWDNLPQEDKERVKEELKRKLGFLDFAEKRYISALHGSGVGTLYEAIDIAYSNAMRNLKTSELNEILDWVIQEHQPPMVNGRRIKLRYAHQGGQNPPIIVVHGNQTEKVPESYKRFMVSRFRKALKLDGTPIRLEFRSTDNPFKDKKTKPKQGGKKGAANAGRRRKNQK